jgi:pimeloyl-ACP methyl ester carboxylesterase
VFCTLDNRGMGRSSTPKSELAYSTEIMAEDVLTLLVRLPQL